ncbi:MFS transporter, DHA1 family, chloramphenicol resistance protein [Nonomuraea pusilla]|uniref:MFS transporter, DHA1 family, chloramphenicol resistance protein n=1 Tax=Nonomuraea pusilla TaxID=46177 RepID=A0A1H7TT26_9ACTN|nr:Cmx/CmrA family chloramphenicol efflux MFS transporter [Nonomuraea pusilla]SEL87659.1 MFS transporter, DHA1 family, chloramphenicol resistance protein [Nonomuraea pusilla]
MPFALYLLALAVFAQGTSEFMLAGLGPDIASDLGVSVPAAGSLTSAFALGMIVGAPLMAVLGMRWPERRALLTFLAVFMAVHVAGAVTTDFAVLVATRVAAALANAGFLAVALTAAAGMAPAGAKGRATSVLLGGVTAACVAGVPAGAQLGQVLGWRSAFWAVAALCVPALAAIVRSVPAAPRPAGAGGGVAGELRALRDRRLQVTLLLGALVNAATFCAFTYLASVVTRVAGIGAGWVPVMLALFGVGSFLGVTIGGRLADAGPGPLRAAAGLALLGGWLAFALAAGDPVAATALVLVQGTLSFAVGSALIAQALYAATAAPSLGGAFATAAFNVGAAAGPWLGGLAIGAGHGFRAPLWVSAALVALALATAWTARAYDRRRVG